jgi:two-component system, cell cycle sensor histidine kinase and response regulator CckA
LATKLIEPTGTVGGEAGHLSKRRVSELAAAALLIAGHVVVLWFRYGTEVASTWGDWLAAAAALLAAITSWTASCQAGPFGKRVWRLVCLSAFLALIGQVLYTYYFDYLHALNNLASWDVLVYFWAVPAIVSLFLSPRDPSSGFRWLRTCDFVQVCTLVLAYELAAVYVPSQWQFAAQAMQSRVLSVGLIFFGLVTLSFLVRGLMTPSRTARRLYLRLAFFFFIFAITTNSTLYALTFSGYRQGIWLDLSWTVTYCLLAVLATTWNDPENKMENGAARSRGAELFSQFSPLLIPAMVFPLAFAVARERLFWSATLGMISFAAASVRLFLVQSQLLVSSRNLQENLALLQAITEGTSDVIFVKDLEGRYLMMNPAGARAFGRRVEEVIGKATTDLFSPEIGRRILEHDRAVVRSGAVQTFEELVTLAGVPRVYLSTRAPYRDPDGRTIGLVGIARDITDRIQAEEEIRRSQQKLRIHFEHTPLAVVEWDVEFRVVAWNSSAERIFGYSRQEAVGRHGSFIFPPLSRQHMDQIWYLLMHQQGGNASTIENLTKDGRSISCEWYNTPLVDSSGRVLGAASLVQDVTERVALDQKLRQSQKMEAIGRLAGGVAHDFNNLLTVINGYSKMALGHLRSSDPLREHLAEINKAGGRAAELTRQLLAFSRKQILQVRALDLNRIVEDMESMLGRLVGEDVELRLTLSVENPLVQADPHQLEQVLMNLTVNARDAMPEGGLLVIETNVVEMDGSGRQAPVEAPAGRYAVLRVSDTGAGMDEATRQQIFEPFFTTKGQGTGLGLSTVQGIVAQSAGYIQVESEPGRGTTFQIFLPAQAESRVEGGKPAAVPALRGRETVLVVEDQENVRDYTLAALQEYGYRAIAAANAGEALAICGREGSPIDLVLTDVVMPHMSGWELVERLSKIRPEMKALYMSGYAEQARVLEQSTHFIEKPFSPGELARKVREVLGPSSIPSRILVADDEASVRSFLRTVLEQDGYEVWEAAEGKQVNALAGQVDLVITDLAMPEQDGIETIRELRRVSPGAKIIVFSGAFGELLKVAKALGADAVMDKPVSPDVLLGKVAQMLRQ